MNSTNDHQSPNSHTAQTEMNNNGTKKQRVRFNEGVLQRSVPSLRDYSQEEIEQYWLSEKEMTKTLDRIAKVAQRMESGKKPRHGSSYRGLENATVEGETEYFYNVQDVVESVLCEQEQQYNKNFSDEDLIAEASKLYSDVTLAVALRRAKSDAREAKKAYRQMEDILSYNPSSCAEEGSSSSFCCTDDDLVPILKTGKDVFLPKEAHLEPSKFQPKRAFSCS
ncbi:unnamed protein product [Cylindrotheca closterium]|uniref:Uncharacterized protein n=1 Tax=Cylindrotheca closterium TaxID=2856 RepID=A0AAD2JHQ0_9STRA|nr:unnamed protein product [Cylindrotheca closterium]